MLILSKIIIDRLDSNSDFIYHKIYTTIHKIEISGLTNNKAQLALNHVNV